MRFFLRFAWFKDRIADEIEAQKLGAYVFMGGFAVLNVVGIGGLLWTGGFAPIPSTIAATALVASVIFWWRTMALRTWLLRLEEYLKMEKRDLHERALFGDKRLIFQGEVRLLEAMPNEAAIRKELLGQRAFLDRLPHPDVSIWREASDEVDERLREVEAPILEYLREVLAHVAEQFLPDAKRDRELDRWELDKVFDDLLAYVAAVEKDGEFKRVEKLVKTAGEDLETLQKELREYITEEGAEDVKAHLAGMAA